MDKIMMIVKLLPMLIEVLKSIESAIPGNSKGEQKLAAVREIMEIADGSIAQVWPTVEKVIGVLVKAFNATGVFTK